MVQKGLKFMKGTGLTFVVDFLLHRVKPYSFTAHQCHSTMHYLILVLVFHYLCRLRGGMGTAEQEFRFKSVMPCNAE